jgi:hypothetical protein
MKNWIEKKLIQAGVAIILIMFSPWIIHAMITHKDK